MLYNALIRTHHITSRKKVAVLKRAADTYNCFVLLRTGGCPGIMYVEGRSADDVGSWVGTVRNLRYKDFQLATRPGPVVRERKDVAKAVDEPEPGVREVESVKEFGALMEERGVWAWWRRGMGYAS
ncbi:hypothetical protein VTN00DRAFT_2432 [Thermoascus crustaceus]|uniref:uncharacterized protein n=1 Tax=Thermoascus crustaceus TaxID=5088 RepID=UPI0037428E10